MLKFIIPAIILFLVVLFWEKINQKIYEKFQIKINNIAIITSGLAIMVVFILLYF